VYSDSYRRTSQSYYGKYESTISYVRLCQTMRQKKQIDLLDLNGNVVCPWNHEISNNLKVSNGRMYEDGLDISTFFWNEIYWLYYYFNDKYGLGTNFDCNDIGDFISFCNNDNTVSKKEMYESTRPYCYIGELCSCQFISEWLVRDIWGKRTRVDEIRWADI
jgi:hypothetical protein